MAAAPVAVCILAKRDVGIRARPAKRLEVDRACRSRGCRSSRSDARSPIISTPKVYGNWKSVELVSWAEDGRLPAAGVERQDSLRWTWAIDNPA